MKRIVALLMLFSMICSSAFALSVSENFTDGSIEISGEATSGSRMAVQIFKSGLTMEDVLNSGEIEESSLYVNQFVVGTDNKYEDQKIKMATSTPTGKYTVYVSSFADKTVEHEDIRYINPDEFIGVVTQLNSYSKADDKTNFDNTILSNGDMFADDTDYYSSISVSTALSNFSRHIKEVDGLSTDRSKLKNVLELYNTFMLMQALNESKVSDIANYSDEIIIPDDIAVWFDNYKDDVSVLAEINKRLKGINITTLDAWEDSLKEAVILSVVKYPGGYLKVKEIMNAFDTYLDVSAFSNNTYRSLAGNDYSSKEALKKAAEQLENGTVQKPSVSGGSGGSGGSGSSGLGGGSYKVSGDIVAETKPVEQINVPFEDIDSVSWATEAIIALADKKIINGKADKQFAPNDSVTREEFIKMLLGALEINSEHTKTIFADVDMTQWYAPYVNTAHKLGISNGIGNNMFGIGMNISRQDMAVLIYNAVKLQYKQGETFNDEAMIADYAKDAVSTLSALKIINGTPEKEFLPQNSATRAEAAQVIYGMLKHK